MDQAKFKLPPGVPPLGTIYLYPTDRCNLNCNHCWVAPQQIQTIDEYIERIKAREITIDQIKDTFIKARDIGCHSVKFTGGEPLLRDDTPELMRWMKEQNISMTIETNGTLIDEKMAKTLKEVGMRHVAISLDGPNAEIHDRLRGQPGAFEQTVQGIKNSVKAGMGVQIIMSLYTDNENLIESTVQLAIQLGANSFKINPVIPSGRALSVAKESRIVPVVRLMHLYKYVYQILMPKYRFRIFFSVPTGLKDFREIVSHTGECHIHFICGLMGNGDISICGIGRTEPELIMGNIKKDDIRDVWVNGPIFKKIREDIPNNLKGICSRCIFKAKCLGSCLAITYAMTGEINNGYWFCEEADRLGLFPESRKFVAEPSQVASPVCSE